MIQFFSLYLETMVYVKGELNYVKFSDLRNVKNLNFVEESILLLNISPYMVFALSYKDPIYMISLRLVKLLRTIYNEDRNELRCFAKLVEERSVKFNKKLLKQISLVITS